MCVYLSLQLWDSFRDGAPCPPPPPGSSKGPLITVLNKPGLSLTPTCCVYFCTGCHNSVQGGSSAWGWKPSGAPRPGSHQSFQKTQQCPFLTPWTLQEVPFMERRAGFIYLSRQQCSDQEKKKKKNQSLTRSAAGRRFVPSGVTSLSQREPSIPQGLMSAQALQPGSCKRHPSALAGKPETLPPGTTRTEQINGDSYCS